MRRRTCIAAAPAVVGIVDEVDARRATAAETFGETARVTTAAVGRSAGGAVSRARFAAAVGRSARGAVSRARSTAAVGLRGLPASQREHDQNRRQPPHFRDRQYHLAGSVPAPKTHSVAVRVRDRVGLGPAGPKLAKCPPAADDEQLAELCRRQHPHDVPARRRRKTVGDAISCIETRTAAVHDWDGRTSHRPPRERPESPARVCKGRAPERCCH